MTQGRVNGLDMSPFGPWKVRGPGQRIPDRALRGASPHRPDLGFLPLQQARRHGSPLRVAAGRGPQPRGGGGHGPPSRARHFFSRRGRNSRRGSDRGYPRKCRLRGPGRPRYPPPRREEPGTLLGQRDEVRSFTARDPAAHRLGAGAARPPTRSKSGPSRDSVSTSRLLSNKAITPNDAHDAAVLLGTTPRTPLLGEDLRPDRAKVADMAQGPLSEPGLGASLGTGKPGAGRSTAGSMSIRSAPRTRSSTAPCW